MADPFLRCNSQILAHSALSTGLSMFWDMGNHLRPFSEAPDRREVQELGGGAVGGQGVLQGVKF